MSSSVLTPVLTAHWDEPDSFTLAGYRRSGGYQALSKALAMAPDSGALVMVAGPQRRIIEISPTGELLAGRALKPKLHRQPEGLAFAPDRTLLISDEAAGARATLTAYSYRP